MLRARGRPAMRNLTWARMMALVVLLVAWPSVRAESGGDGAAQSVPSVPQGLQASPRSTLALVHLEWTAPASAGSGPTTYRVYRQVFYFAPAPVLVAETAATSFDIPSTEYWDRFLVSAVNADGEGPAANTSYLRAERAAYWAAGGDVVAYCGNDGTRIGGLCTLVHSTRRVQYAIHDTLAPEPVTSHFFKDEGASSGASTCRSGEGPFGVDVPASLPDEFWVLTFQARSTGAGNQVPSGGSLWRDLKEAVGTCPGDVATRGAVTFLHELR